ncbi:MAG TPA: ABC transporter permease [Stellaceae bacterium]|nr:ABC transporter permease [Stellaceae bacterium]
MSPAFLLRRLFSGLLSLAILSLLIFACTHVLPGDAATAILGENATPEALQAIRVRLGLDRPLTLQYAGWLAGALRGDLGVSATFNQPVAEVIGLHVANSMTLAAITLAAAALIAIPLGVIAAVRRGKALDATILTGSYLGISVPDFVIAPLLILVFAGPPLQLLPSSGYVPLGESSLGWLAHIALPTATLTLVLIAHLMRQTRSGMIDVLASEYVRTARLKGLPERMVLLRHALRNGLTTSITVLALDFGYLMGSIVIVEEIFAYPGLGRLIVYAVANRDLPLVQGAALLIGAVYVGANLLADWVHGLLNPRVAAHA